MPPIGDELEYIIRGGPSPKSQIQYNHYFARSKNDLPSILNNDLSFTQANFDGNCPQGAGKRGPCFEATKALGNYLPNGDDWIRCGGYCEETYQYRIDPDIRYDPFGFHLFADPVG